MNRLAIVINKKRTLVKNTNVGGGLFGYDDDSHDCRGDFLAPVIQFFNCRCISTCVNEFQNSHFSFTYPINNFIAPFNQGTVFFAIVLEIGFPSKTFQVYFLNRR